MSKKIVIYINTDRLGRGDDALGTILMEAYLETLLNTAPTLSHVLLINSGVKLICENSPHLEIMQQLATLDIEILACGTCINHYGLKKTMKVGSISNMATIFEIQASAAHVLMP